MFVRVCSFVYWFVLRAVPACAAGTTRPKCRACADASISPLPLIEDVCGGIDFHSKHLKVPGLSASVLSPGVLIYPAQARTRIRVLRGGCVGVDVARRCSRRKESAASPPSTTAVLDMHFMVALLATLLPCQARAVSTSCPLGWDLNSTAAGTDTDTDPWLYHPRFHFATPIVPGCRGGPRCAGMFEP